MISYGFTFVTFENYSFEEQIKIIDNCELLVGIHGAGFTNMVFMNKNTKIVDITPYYYSLPRTEEFKIICEILGLKNTMRFIQKIILMLKVSMKLMKSNLKN